MELILGWNSTKKYGILFLNIIRIILTKNFNQKYLSIILKLSIFTNEISYIYIIKKNHIYIPNIINN